MTGSDLIIKILTEEGITRCFGYPGGAAMPIYDSLYKMRSKIKHVRTAKEDGAAHAADGYARSSGNIAALFATSGPGATNLITGIATAFSDSVPMIVITANVTTAEIGTDSFQEADITGMTMSITKYNWIVKDPDCLASVIYKAIKLAKAGRPGPVLVDVPRDILEHKFSQRYNYRRFASLSGNETELRLKEQNKSDENAIVKAAEMINSAKKPVIICGGGIALSGMKARDNILKLSEALKAPITYTLMAAGLIPKDNPQNAGMIGKYGAAAALEAISKSDLIIAVAMRFSNRTHRFSLNDKKIIHIDSDPAELNKNVHVSIPLLGDCGEILNGLLPKIENKKTFWCRETFCNTETVDKYDICFKKIAEAMNDEQIIVSDVGMHQMMVANKYPFRGNHRFITSGGFGTMGFGIGAAIGAKLGNASCDVVLITGDGSFKMSAEELLTLRENNIKILIIVMNNASLEMVRKMQENEFNKHYFATKSSKNVPNIKMLARAYGLLGVTVNNADNIDEALDVYKKAKKSVVVDLRME